MTPNNIRKCLLTVRSALESGAVGCASDHLDAIINELPQIPERGDILEIKDDDDEEVYRVVVFRVDEAREVMHASCLFAGQSFAVEFDDDFVIVGKVELPE